MSARLELDRIRERRDAGRATTRLAADPGAPAMVGRVVSPAAKIAPKKYLLVQPVSVLGAECEGCAPTLTAGTATIPALLLGPRVPAPGDDLVCRFVDHRWVVEQSSAPSGGGLPPPYCTIWMCNLTWDQISGATAYMSHNFGQGVDAVLAPQHYADVDQATGRPFAHALWASPVTHYAGGANGTREIFVQYILTTPPGFNCNLQPATRYTYADGSPAPTAGYNTFTGQWVCSGTGLGLGRTAYCPVRVYIDGNSNGGNYSLGCTNEQSSGATEDPQGEPDAMMAGGEWSDDSTATPSSSSSSAAPMMAAADSALAMAVDSCPFGQSGNCGCNGQPRTCTKSGTPVEVDRATTCFECQRAEAI